MFKLVSNIFILFKGNAVATAISAYDKWRPIYQEGVNSLSPKARKIWRATLVGSKKTIDKHRGKKRKLKKE